MEMSNITIEKLQKEQRKKDTEMKITTILKK